MTNAIRSRKSGNEPRAARGRPREFDVDEVLDRASRTFWNHGYHATSIDDLCEATGVLRGSLYGVFGDKHGLLLAAVDHYSEGVIARLAERLSAGGSATESLREALLHYAKITNALSGQRSCFITNTTLEMQADDAELREKIESFHRRTTTLLTAAVIRGQAAGEFDPSLDEGEVGRYLLCVTQGLRVMSKVVDDEAQLADVVDLALRSLT
ncbi:TetR family transcriptional regulator [Paraburkholderia sp. NMBU_R16]|uniref:TetR/AcrR family transcriptional regulator n=1 Tax=Paraburkholderia sp. NMBU_R16 TaxID=2698676 RepID=UPI00156539EF|nr:TetR/AcrR family transcriptional regulator [Paraburkholderia sp. NMBU_R16]NRO95100.1 TetR family transcriptional regulator [Paraburkholderia sp. NMBU_R16]